MILITQNKTINMDHVICLATKDLENYRDANKRWALTALVRSTHLILGEYDAEVESEKIREALTHAWASQYGFCVLRELEKACERSR